MAYNRVDAVDYADRHWNIPTGDGLFWLNSAAVKIDQVRKANILRQPGWRPAPKADGWEPFFVDDGLGGEKAVFVRGSGATREEILINAWAGISDCAHFLSQCLTAGGAKTEAIAVGQLVGMLQARSDTKTLCEKVSREAGQRIIDAGVLKPGDMIGYFNIDPHGDYGGRKAYAHSTMYAGKIGGSTDGGITCHTICRFPGRSWVEDSWWLKPAGHYTYTFIHFSADDPIPNPVRLAATTGWWRVDYGSRSEFYFVEKSGTARFTKVAPKPGQTAIHGADGSAYWFMAASGAITLVWKNTGTVEVWSPDGANYKSVVNGSMAWPVTRFAP